MVLSSRFPLPLEKGDKLRLYHQIKYLSRQHDIILVSLTEKPFDQTLVKSMQKYCREIYVVPHDRRGNMLNALGGLWYGLPVNVGYFYNRSTHRKIDGIIEKTRPDLIYVQLLRMAPYVRDIRSIDMAIDYMDAFSLRVLRRARQSSWITGLLWRLEARLLERQERKAAHRFKQRFIIADTDRIFLRDSGIKEPFSVIKNGVDTDFYRPDVTATREFDIVFVGNMSYHPNILAAEYLVQVIGEHLRNLRPDLRILIAGADPVPAVRNLAGNHVVVSGFMPDIRKAYASGKVFVAPIFAGSGMQNKILEAMAMELPCVTTPQVIDAIGGVADLIYAAGDKEDFVRHLVRLLDDTGEREETGRRSREHIIKYLSWEACCRPLDKLNNQ